MNVFISCRAFAGVLWLFHVIFARSSQAELRNSKLENEALRAGQAGLAAAKQNAEAALQHLLQVTTSSRASIR